MLTLVLQEPYRLESSRKHSKRVYDRLDEEREGGSAGGAARRDLRNAATHMLFLDGLAALSRSEPPNLKAEPGIASSRFTGAARLK